MGKKPKKNIPTTEFENQNTGTYSTGFTAQPKESSGLIAVLLVLVIFLGGLASGLGILNIRLLTELMNQADPTVPMDIYTHPSGSVSVTPDGLHNNTDPAPTVPETRDARLQLEPPSRLEPSGSLSEEALYEHAKKSLVFIQSSTNHNNLTGLGVVISTDGYILTNAHMVESASRIYVTDPAGQLYRASLVGTDVLTDLAVLYIEAQGLTAAAFADSAELTTGTVIASAGSLPDQDMEKLTFGVLSEPNLSMNLGNYSTDLMQTTVGSCDGPLFNSHGQIIGMNTGEVSAYFSLYLRPNTGYAIPSATVKEVVDQILEYGFVKGRPTLGIETESITKVYQKYWDLPGGLRITQVSRSLMRKGLQEGDILLALNGVRLTRNENLYRMLYVNDLYSDLTAVIFRNGETFTVTLTIYDMVA